MKPLHTQRKIFVIATCIFVTSMSVIFFLVGEDKLNVENQHMQASILHYDAGDLPLNEDVYRKIINNKNDDFVIVNIDRTLAYISENLQEIHGYKLDETGEMNVLTFVHPKDMSEFSHNLMEYHKTLEAINNIGPIRLKTKSGEYIPYLISLIPLKDNSGERIATAVVLNNISKALGEVKQNPTVIEGGKVKVKK